MNSPAVRPKPTAHQINMAAIAQSNGGPAMTLPTIPSGHPNSYQHGSCDAIYGQHAMRLNNGGVTKILAGNQSPAMSAISEPIYAMRMPRINCAPPSQMSSLEMTTNNPRIVNNKASEVPMLDAIKCDSMYSAAARTTNGCSETDKLLQQSTN